MKKLILFSVLAALWLYFRADAQDKSQQKLLTVGDTMPNVKILNLHDYKSTEVKISDFKGKLLILDFWSTWCSNCLAAFPREDSLAVQFKKDLAIVLVNSDFKTGDDWNRISYTFKRGYKPEYMPVAYNDTILNALLKHHTLPHYVWINSNGVICAITGARQITAKNIQSVLKGERISLPIKVDK